MARFSGEDIDHLWIYSGSWHIISRPKLNPIILFVLRSCIFQSLHAIIVSGHFAGEFPMAEKSKIQLGCVIDEDEMLVPGPHLEHDLHVSESLSFVVGDRPRT